MPVTKIQRTEILQRCWEVLHHEGYNGASISMLAEATGLGKAGLLHHFQSKEVLMRSVIDYAFDRFREYVLSVANEPLPMEQRLEKLLRRQNRLAKRDRNGCFFGNTALELGRNEQFNKRLGEFFLAWQDVVSGIFATVMPEAQARETTYRLLLEYQGAVTLYKISGDEQHLEGLVHRALQSFLSYEKSIV